MRLANRYRWLALPVVAAIAVAVDILMVRADAGVEVSYSAGGRDAAGVFMGGTELRALATYRGKLYAGNGYWEDRPGEEGRQGAEILVLDAPDARWRVEHGFGKWISRERRRDLAISALGSATFETDGAGAPLRESVSMLLASAWDLTGATRVFSRDDATGAWSTVTLAEDRPAPNFLPQIRSFGRHRDRATGVDRVFAGQDPRGIFSGVYDPAVPGRIRWGARPELDISAISTDGFPGLAGRLRIGSFAEANGLLYAGVGQQIYERADGPEPRWRRVYTNPRLRKSETGLRGLTAIPNPSGPGEALLAAIEGNESRIIRIDPRDGQETTGLPLVAVRTIAASPFPGDDALYFGGYDANSRPAHNTAWLLRAGTAAALGDR